LFRCSDLSHYPRVATLKEKVEAEQATRALLAHADLPQPDAVEYGYTCIRLLWMKPKACMIVQIDEPPEGWVDPIEEFGQADAQGGAETGESPTPT
jgi:hypothetical protein